MSVLKAWGDAKVLQGSLQEAGTLYEQALGIQPDSLDIIVVKLLDTNMNSWSVWSDIEDMTLCCFDGCALCATCQSAAVQNTEGVLLTCAKS